MSIGSGMRGNVEQLVVPGFTRWSTEWNREEKVRKSNEPFRKYKMKSRSASIRREESKGIFKNFRMKR